MSQKKNWEAAAAVCGSKQERCVSLAKYIIDNRTTVRDAGKVFGISKSTVHQDITARLEKVDHRLYEQVRDVLEQNKQERHIRGGMATKRKYSELAKNAG